ncbi:unnamed protein product [Phytophthora fragariaefolia]|uniref:Unnamed protein product n=1 Tax=Phytophthora fragariaefolia TaxID=1490495 RepID=A0A9W6TS27_9STRA|nr:unnamed protein product [Phytophthora fragariaefolia]
MACTTPPHHAIRVRHTIQLVYATPPSPSSTESALQSTSSYGHGVVGGARVAAVRERGAGAAAYQLGAGAVRAAQARRALVARRLRRHLHAERGAAHGLVALRQRRVRAGALRLAAVSLHGASGRFPAGECAAAHADQRAGAAHHVPGVLRGAGALLLRGGAAGLQLRQADGDRAPDAALLRQGPAVLRAQAHAVLPAGAVATAGHGHGGAAVRQARQLGH